MKKKVLVYVVPVLTAFLLFGFAIGSDIFTSDLSQTPDFIPGMPITPSLVGDSCAGTGQERHDDQNFENGGGWLGTVTDGRYVTKFRPSSYPWKYNKFCIAFTRTAAANNDSLNFDIMIFDTTGAGGIPGAAKDSVMGLVARNIPIYPQYAWYSYDIASKPSTLVNNGSIYIGHRYNATNQTARYVMMDQSVTTPLWPGYSSSNFGAWTPAQSGFASYRAFGMRTMGSTPPPPSTNTLVIINDSTATTAQRTADRDTLRRYVNMLVGGNVTWLTKNTTSTFPDLSTYSTIIFQETSFDAVAVRGLSATQRQALKDWLASGTSGNKKSLMMIGGDLGYAYDQTGQTTLDTVFSRSYGGFQWLSDNAAAAGFASVALTPPGTTYDVMNPAGTSYWPDGCRPISGGTAFEKYLNRSTSDSAAGIYKSGAGWNVISTFQDPRYFTGAGDGSGDKGFKRVFSNMLTWVKNNGGIILSVNPIPNIVAERYSLSQNYPNPFNPTTKINFSIPKSGLVTMKVYNVTGQEVMTLVNESMTAGVYSVDFNGSSLSSGVYFYRLETGSFVETKKMLLVK